MSTAEDRLLAEMSATARGPKRNGFFALWLFLRQCDGSLPPTALSLPAQVRRLDRLERRLSSLSLPAPLRRAFPNSLRELRTSESRHVELALRQLVAPTREALGPSAGDSVSLAARASRRALRHTQEDRAP